MRFPAALILCLLSAAAAWADPPQPRYVSVGWTDGSVTTIPPAGGKLSSEQIALARQLFPPVDPVPPSPWQPEPPLAPNAKRILVTAAGGLSAVASVLSGDHLLFEAGGTWTGNVILSKSGVWMGAYGAGVRPVILSPGGTAVATFGSINGLRVGDIDLRPANPAADVRGDGLNFGGTITGLRVDHLSVVGFEQNIVIDGRADRPALSFVLSAYAHGRKADAFKGQGLYANGANGLTVTDSVLYHNGRATDTDRPSIYDHGFYGQRGAAAPAFLRCLVARNSACGLQFRDGGSSDTNLLYDNGCGIYAVGGAGVAATNTVVVSGHRGWDGENWTGNTGIATSTRLTLAGVAVLGLPGQGEANPKFPGHKSGSYDVGGIQVNRSYKPHPEWAPGGRLTLAGPVTVQGWPGAPVSGDAMPIDKATKRAIVPAGVVVKAQAPDLSWLAAEVDAAGRGEAIDVAAIVARVRQAAGQ